MRFEPNPAGSRASGGPGAGRPRRRRLRERRLVRRGVPIKTDTYVVADKLIWGATARILAMLFERLDRGDEFPDHAPVYRDMSKVSSHLGFAGRLRRSEPERGEPARRGGRSDLHDDWVFDLKGLARAPRKEGRRGTTPAIRYSRRRIANVGAEIMGRGKFGPPGGGPWGDDPWPGWWGEDPPFHKPVFVLTHHEREPLTLSDTTFTFVTEGIESALAQASEDGGGQDDPRRRRPDQQRVPGCWAGR